MFHIDPSSPPPIYPSIHPSVYPSIHAPSHTPSHPSSIHPPISSVRERWHGAEDINQGGHSHDYLRHIPWHLYPWRKLQQGRSAPNQIINELFLITRMFLEVEMREFSSIQQGSRPKYWTRNYTSKPLPPVAYTCHVGPANVDYWYQDLE